MKKKKEELPIKKEDIIAVEKGFGTYSGKLIKYPALEKLHKWLKKKRRKYYCKNGLLHSEAVVDWSDIEEVFKFLR